ncbi:hypothetical protein, partial [Escherichia coli]|uniref:hypothetical protein n=1 Tax=Escherichia coli TaxID=562 RepID=UPI001BC8B38C
YNNKTSVSIVDFNCVSLLSRFYVLISYLQTDYFSERCAFFMQAVTVFSNSNAVFFGLKFLYRGLDML